MAKKSAARYLCSECGYMSLTLVGRCPGCGEWGTMSEEAPAPSGGSAVSRVTAKPIASLDVKPEERVPSGIAELDRVLGGGWVKGGVVLLGGEPGVGKSTLLLQACAFIAKGGHRVLYISGEESAGQLAMRARRLGISEKNVDLLCDADLLSMLEAAAGYEFLVVDSVQAFRIEGESGWSGSPSQVRNVASRAAMTAKSLSIPMVMVGHITKQGTIAGPKILEHMVDVVLLFSGERNSSHRLLRAEKNRYGATDELGIFEMTEGGLAAVTDPSRMYWGMAGSVGTPGVAAGVSLEGSRPLVAEIQALSCATPFPYPKRTARGIEVNRLQLLLAVLERRCGIFSRNSDVYVNVAGGLSLQDPAADLSICAALASSFRDVALPEGVCFIGEVGLAGEIRPTAKSSLRVREAARLGFKAAVMSARDPAEKPEGQDGFLIIKVGSVSAMLERFLK
ncbi:MAG: DNA repair protein RadA [Synergistaceae bacterium]|jgi:DNA repair protein RadA/Sms|nr:DNA repair protein RadA [Synergistaceae bacterium]